MSDDVTTYLREELSKADRQLRVTLIAGGVIAVFMIGYFTWIKSQVADILEPSSLADFIANETRRALPDAREVVGQGMTRAAPEVVHFMLTQVVDGVLPNLTNSVKTHLDEYAQELAHAGSDGVMTAFGTCIADYKAQVGKKKGAPVSTADGLTAHLEGNLAQHLDKASEATLRTKLEGSSAALRQLNTELRSMAARHTLTREDELGKRLVTTWWTFLDRNRPHLPGGELWNEVPKPGR